MRFLEKLKDSISKTKNVAIFTHKNSDHDDICSAVALQQILQQFGKKSTIFIDTMPNDSILKFVPNVKFELSSNENFDVGISVDCADIKRLNTENMQVFIRCKETFNIDHHQDNTNFAMNNWVKRSWSSCCEVLYWLFKSSIKMNKEIAELLYTGIYMDCGAFTYSSTSPKTHKCVADLMKYCPNINERFFISFGITNSENFDMTKKSFNSVRFYANKQIAVSILTQKDLKECNSTAKDKKFITSYLPGVTGVKISITMTEDENKEWRISLRTSEKNINVANIAHKFNGGGHVQASGLTLKGDLEKALRALICECKKELK